MRDLSYRTHYDSLTDRVTAGTSFGSLSTGTDITTTTSQTRPLSLDTIQTDIQSHV